MTTTNQPFFIRMARSEDVPVCHAIDVEAWGEDSAASEEMMLERIRSYPFGNLVAIDPSSEEIVGSVWSMPITSDAGIRTWSSTTGNGSYGSACDPFGDVTFGVNVSARKAYAGQKLGQILIIRGVEIGWCLGRRFAMMGARIPCYHLWQHVLTPDDYARMEVDDDKNLYFPAPEDPKNLVCAGREATSVLNAGQPIDPRSWVRKARTSLTSRTRLLDPELAYLMDIVVTGDRCSISRVIPGYFPDPDSCDNGVLIGWKNPHHPANR
jgi:hypothetical protein